MSRRTGLSIASAASVAAIVFCLGRGLLLPFVGLHQDDGHYLATGKSIATGAGYRAAQWPDEPWQTKFPPVFPLSLSLAWSVSSDWPSVAQLQALQTLTFGALAAGLLCLAMVRIAGLPNSLAALATAAASTTPALLAITAQVMSESLFMVWLAVAFWALSVPHESRFAKTRGIWLALLVLTRSAGVFICAAAALWLWRRRALTWTVTIPVAIAIAGWFGWAQYASVGARSPAYDVSYVRWLATVGLAAWPRVVVDNLLAIPVHGGSLVMQAPMMLLPAPLRPEVGFVAGMMLLAAVVWAARSSPGVWRWLLAVYVAGIVLWPWPPSRFLVVVIPLTLCSLLAATRPGSHTRRAMVVGLIVLGLSNTAAALTRRSDPRWSTGYALSDGTVAPWPEYSALFDAIRRATPPDAIIASVAESMVFLYTDRHSVFPYAQDTFRLNYSPTPSLGNWHALDERLSATHAGFLVRLPAPTWAHTGALDEVIAALQAARPGRLRSLYRGTDARFELFEIARDETGR